jgi:hypothetical protein
MRIGEQGTETAAPISDGLIDEIAAEACAHRRSVIRRLACLPVRGNAGRRIDAALIRRGLLVVGEGH